LPKVEALINLAYATINAFETFDPATSDRQFRLAGNDLVCTLLGPLINLLAKSAPHAQVSPLGSCRPCPLTMPSRICLMRRSSSSPAADIPGCAGASI
jgi:hypothetical protein